MQQSFESLKESLIRNLIFGGPSGWWVRVADHDDTFFQDKKSAVAFLEEILQLDSGTLSA